MGEFVVDTKNFAFLIGDHDGIFCDIQKVVEIDIRIFFVVRVLEEIEKNFIRHRYSFSVTIAGSLTTVRLRPLALAI